MQKPPPLGFGLGLRPVYYQDILESKPAVDWFEVISENFMVDGGTPLATLERIRADYPIVLHGVSMSIASTAPLDFDYLAALKSLADRFEPAWFPTISAGLAFMASICMIFCPSPIRMRRWTMSWSRSAGFRTFSAAASPSRMSRAM